MNIDLTSSSCSGWRISISGHMCHTCGYWVVVDLCMVRVESRASGRGVHKSCSCAARRFGETSSLSVDAVSAAVLVVVKVDDTSNDCPGFSIYHASYYIMFFVPPACGTRCYSIGCAMMLDHLFGIDV